jgi:lysyl-tRNA synthetase class 2
VGRPTWPFAVPVAAAAIAVGLPTVAPSLSDRPAELLVGELFPGGQELLLALILLATARGLLLRRRVAHYVAMTLIVVSVLDALNAHEFGRVLILVTAAVALVRYRDEFDTAPSRVRTAVRAGLVAYGAAIAYGLVIVIVERHHVTAGETGWGLLAGLSASGTGPLHLGGPADQWFEAGMGILGGGGLLAMLMTLLSPAPAPPPGSERERAEAARLVDADDSDTLAPFLLRGDKSYVFSPDRRAVIGYRVLFGVAAAGADPAGHPDSYADAVAEFAALAHRSGWRMAVLGARSDLLRLWEPYGMHAIGIGDEVLLSTGDFGLSGRAMRNVRQAVQRTHNAGVTTEVVREGDLPEPDRTTLRALATEAMGGVEERGFSMNMDGMLTGRHAFPVLVIARGADGAPVGFQRYLPSASGRRLSLDSMRRAPGSPNGLNERMIADIMAYAAEQRVAEVSLNFAAFRELFETPDRGVLEQGTYHVIHLLDRFVKVESLYLFNRKFKPRYVARKVMFPSWTSLLPIAVALLTLEFGHWRASGEPATAETVSEDSYATLPTYPGW